jgi:hypothetical protein
MTQRTRYFLVGSGLLVVVGLCTGVVAYYSDSLPGRDGLGPAELSYIPADTSALVYADVRHIMDSQFHQRLRSLLPTGDEKNRLLAETGIDVEHDIDSVVAGFDPTGPAGSTTTGHVALLRGRFKTDDVERVALNHGATIEDYRGVRIVMGAMPAAGASAAATTRTGLAFLEPTLLALGDESGIKQAIDAGATHENVAGNPDLMKFVNGVAHNGDAWIVGRFDTLAKDANLAPGVRDQFGALQWFSMSADVDQTISCRIHAEARDAQSADELRSVVTGMVSAARLVANQDARVDGVLNSIQTSGVGPGIDVSFTVPPEMLDLVTNAAHGTLPHQP